MTREAALSVVLAHVVRNKEDFPTRAEHEALRRDCEECCPALVAKPGDLFILRALNLIQGTQHTHTNFTVEYQGRMTEENEVTAGRLIFSNFSSDIFYRWEGDSLFLPIPLLTILFRSGLWKRLMPLTHVSGSSMETSIRSSSFCHLMSAFD